jgi:hypothetical protein
VPIPSAQCKNSRWPSGSLNEPTQARDDNTYLKAALFDVVLAICFSKLNVSLHLFSYGLIEIPNTVKASGRFYIFNSDLTNACAILIETVGEVAPLIKIIDSIFVMPTVE